MSCEVFAEYLGESFRTIKECLVECFKEAILEESISPSIFAQMTPDNMKDTFTDYLGNEKYGFGIKTQLHNVQKSVRFTVFPKNATDDTVEETLRPFGGSMPSNKTTYRCAQVRVRAGNLLVPQHEFIFPEDESKCTRHYIAKELVRFTAACINGRKNGTVHFGVRKVSCETEKVGMIEGISKRCTQNLPDAVNKAIEESFKIHASLAFACLGPVQVIPMDNGDTVVVEADVTPLSGLLPKEMIPIFFPPKGTQRKQYFVYDFKQNSEILPISANKIQDVENAFEKVLKLREHIETETCGMDLDLVTTLQNKLVRLLTGGNKYVKDEFEAVIVTGNISGSSDEQTIRSKLNIENAFTSAADVLDFDSSTQLQDSVEKEKISFKIVKAEDIQNLKESYNQPNLPLWVYCNGYKKLDSTALPLSEWVRERQPGVKRVLERIRGEIPENRCVLIFLVYSSPKYLQQPMFEVAREALSSSFRNECVVITDKKENVTDLRQEVSRLVSDSELDECFVTGLEWSHVSRVFNTVFEANADVVCKLPCSTGHYEEMTLREKESLKLNDIEIISGEQCQLEEINMSDDVRKKHRKDMQLNFYKGESVSWWNFYYGTQVGPRSQFDLHVKEIRDKLRSKRSVEIHEIEHHPGAGGSTLARHLLWEFSQFRNQPNRAYRCCVVNSITVDTVKQIENFRTFKDSEDTKPFIVLLDNKSEEDVMMLRGELSEKAYKYTKPGRLFCLILIVTRKPVSYKKAREKHLLTHELTPQERNWFETKYEEMEETKEMDVKTLLAFNCVRMSFKESYMQEVTTRLMQEVTSKEREVLKCLSLINSYENDDPVPQNVFDKMMNEKYEIDLITRQPFGIALHIKEIDRMAMWQRRTWNVDMSNAMMLILTKKNHGELKKSGVCIISQLLAKAVLRYIMDNDDLCLEKIVNSVLDLVELHRDEDNVMSKKFVSLVSSLFKTRQVIDSERGDFKYKFSDLVLELEKPVSAEEDKTIKNQRVLRLMQRCFDITNDAMVGQQLARFNIHICSFRDAETAIERSISLRPQSSYLLDTYGQIFKARMAYEIESYRRSETIPDDKAAEIVNLALQAVAKFREGEEMTKKFDEDTNWSCFHMEVKTYLLLLEKFRKFSCYESRENFLAFLNNTLFDVEASSFKELMQLCPSLDDIRLDRGPQNHVNLSLRNLEEKFYQIKKRLFVVHTDSDDVLLLKLREQFEMFYGSSGKTSRFKFLYGVGLKPLEHAKEKSPDIFKKRFKEADYNLQSDIGSVDERDLLVYLGARIIELSNQTAGGDKCDVYGYETMLKYSSKLVDQQSKTHAAGRLYLESFLYHAMLHWPLSSRLALNLEMQSGPESYMLMLERWERAFNDNFYLTSVDKRRKNKPKNFFALAKGSPGNDIVDLDSIKRQWEKKKGRKHVYRDYFWGERFVRERLLRLEGTVDGSGHVILHKVKYPPNNPKSFRINTYYPCDRFSNRDVTFVLGFSWKGPTAFDVNEKGIEDLPVENMTKNIYGSSLEEEESLATQTGNAENDDDEGTASDENEHEDETSCHYDEEFAPPPKDHYHVIANKNTRSDDATLTDCLRRQSTTSHTTDSKSTSREQKCGCLKVDCGEHKRLRLTKSHLEVDSYGDFHAVEETKSTGKNTVIECRMVADKFKQTKEEYHGYREKNTQTIEKAVKKDKKVALKVYKAADEDDRTAGKDEKTTGKDDRTAEKDKKAAGKDEKSAGKDNRAVGKDDKAPGNKEKAAGKDDGAAGKKNKAGGKDDKAASINEKATGKNDRTPGKDKKTADKIDRAAGKNEKSADKDERAAGKDDKASSRNGKADDTDERDAGKYEKAGGKDDKAAGKVEKAAGKDDRAAGKDKKKVGKIDKAAGKDENSADKDERTVGKDDKAPGKVDKDVCKLDKESSVDDKNNGEADKASKVNNAVGKNDMAAGKADKDTGQDDKGVGEILKADVNVYKGAEKEKIAAGRVDKVIGQSNKTDSKNEGFYLSEEKLTSLQKEKRTQKKTVLLGAVRGQHEYNCGTSYVSKQVTLKTPTTPQEERTCQLTEGVSAAVSDRQASAEVERVRLETPVASPLKATAEESSSADKDERAVGKDDKAPGKVDKDVCKIDKESSVDDCPAN